MSSLIRWERIVKLRRETVWGEASPSSARLPIPCTNYDVAVRRTAAHSASFCGVRTMLAQGPARHGLAGRLVAPLFTFHADGKSIAEYVIGWSLGPATFLPSFTCELAEGSLGAREHTGPRIDALVLEGSVKSGRVDMELALEGREDRGSSPGAALAPPAAAFVRFADVSLVMNEASSSGSVSVALRAMRLEVRNHLGRYHNASVLPTSLPAGRREVRLDIVTPKGSHDFDEWARSLVDVDIACQLTFTGPHLGTAPTGTRTQIDLELPRMRWTRRRDSAGPDGVVDDVLSLVALRSGSSEEIVMTTSLV